MKITKTVVITAAGDLRIARSNPKAGKGELIADLTVELPDSAFAPPRLSLVATLAPVARVSPVAEPKPANGRTPAPRALVQDDGRPWTGERVRSLMARLGIDRDGLAMSLGVSAATVKRWETSGNVEALYRDEMMTLESDAREVAR